MENKQKEKVNVKKLILVILGIFVIMGIGGWWQMRDK